MLDVHSVAETKLKQIYELRMERMNMDIQNNVKNPRNSSRPEATFVRSKRDVRGAKATMARSFALLLERYGFDTYSVPFSVSRVPLLPIAIRDLN